MLTLFLRNGWNDSRSSTPSFRTNDAFHKPTYDRASRSGHVTPDRGGGGWGGGGPRSGSWNPRQKDYRGGGGGSSRGYGTWENKRHVVGEHDDDLKKELFGVPNDPSKQHTGINFEKYDDIPVEATGAGVPEPITNFQDSELHPLLLENITYANYNTPTPVQKYSVPIVAAERDLMACAQVCPITPPIFFHTTELDLVRLAQGKPLASSSPFFLLPSRRVLVFLPLTHPPVNSTIAARPSLPP